MNLIEMLEKTALNKNLIPAFIDEKETLDYKMFLERSRQVAMVLKQEGVKKGDLILLLEPISIRLYLFLVAIWSLGATVVIFDPSAGKSHIEKCLKRIDLKVFIGMRKAMLLKFTLPSLRKIPKIFTVDQILKRSQKLAPTRFIECVEEHTPALITFTSGSTHIPKAIVRSHYFLIKQYEVLEKTLDYQEKDIDLATMPVFTLANLAKGITTVIPNDSLGNISKIKAGALVKQIKRIRITRLSCSPTIALLLAAHVGESEDLASIKRLNIGGGPIFPHMLPVLQRSFSHATITIVYGSSEAEPISELQSTTITEEVLTLMKQGKGLYVGKPVETIQCKIVKRNKIEAEMTEEMLNEALCPPNTPGEIIVTGEHVLKSYLQGIGDEENKIKTSSGIWHRTGDLGHLDDQEGLWLLGRTMATKEERGQIIYPFAIECEVCVKYNLARAAYLFHKGKHILVIEKPTGMTLKAEDREDLKQKYQLEDIIEVKEIPLDCRHRAKVEYGKLIGLVEKK